jgi:P27 family predicted phage terminase small subunit
MKNSFQPPPAPKYLSAPAKRWWKRLHEEYELNAPDQLLLLESALQGFDRWKQAQAIIDKDGLVLEDRFKQKKIHPAALAERDAKQTMLRALRQLGLDIVAPNEIGRPPG